MNENAIKVVINERNVINHHSERKNVIRAYWKYRRKLIFALSTKELILLIKHFLYDNNKTEIFIQLIKTKGEVYMVKKFLLQIFNYNKGQSAFIAERYLLSLMNYEEKEEFFNRIINSDKGALHKHINYFLNFTQESILINKYKGVLLFNKYINETKDTTIGYIDNKREKFMRNIIESAVSSKGLSNKTVFSIWAVVYTIVNSGISLESYFNLIEMGIMNAINNYIHKGSLVFSIVVNTLLRIVVKIIEREELIMMVRKEKMEFVLREGMKFRNFMIEYKKRSLICHYIIDNLLLRLNRLIDIMGEAINKKESIGIYK